jgi:hypothetical protein
VKGRVCRHGISLIGKATLSLVGCEPGEPLRIAKGQRPQENGVDHAEDGDIGADAQRQDQYGDQGEAAIPAQDA